ncbi:unnamed protein product, partial [Adineta ricciae]
MAQVRRYSTLPNSSVDDSHRLSDFFCSDEGYRLLGTVLSDEYKLLQDTKKILEERLALDKQYAKSLQELAAKADRIAWPTDTHSIASACHGVLMLWSRRATTISSNADEFRRLVLDDLLKNLLENKADAKRVLEDRKRQYDDEHRKVRRDVLEADKHYSNEAKVFVTKNNELNKISGAARIGNDNRITDLKRVVIDKRDNVYRAHNAYVLTVRDCNEFDEQYVHKLHDLIDYHEKTQLILNRQWLDVLQSIAKYNNDYSNSSSMDAESLQELDSTDPRHCYNELCKIHSNIPSLTTRPIEFNDLLLKTSGLTNLEVDTIVADDTVGDSTISALRRKITTLTDEINKANTDLSAVLQVIDQIRDKDTSYHGRKSYFEQKQRANDLQMKIVSKGNLKEHLEEVLDHPADENETLPYQEILFGLSDRLEDQAYFHGRMPRSQSINLCHEKGDYLVRINDQNKTVLSILWTDSNHPGRLRDFHIYICDRDNMYYFVKECMKPSIPALIIFYARQKLDITADGIRLLRPIERPDYIINNDEVILEDKLGQGNFGEVHRGKYRNVPVAVKVLRETNRQLTPKDRTNFINEALLLKTYKHKQIVSFYGIAAYREPLMIVMELVEKGSLNTYLEKNRDICASKLTQMCYEIAKGMAYLESCNVIHRDLAARNCLVDKNGRVKVADFGLSRCLQDDEDYFNHTEEVPVRWWAVEVLCRGPYTTKADVWSFGITAWEVFSEAALPYTHIQNAHFVINAVKQGERLQRPNKCPTNIFDIINTCWRVDPATRPSFK